MSKGYAILDDQGLLPSSQMRGLENQIIVGVKGAFQTLKAALDWFNASATSNVEFLLDGENFQIDDTIMVDASFDCRIRGLGSSVTLLEAATGLTGKPMFDIRSNCDIHSVTLDGSTLALYGTLANENAVTYSTNAGNYSELVDIIINNFKIGVADLIATDIFVFNFIISTCGTGIAINHAGTASLDAETGNFESCPVGVDLIAATSDEFTLINLVFLNAGGGIGIRYNGATYTYGNLANVYGCTWNGVGTYVSGFDFTRADGRDANIEMANNIGMEDKLAHAKINCIGNTTKTNLAVLNQFYACNYTNTSSYTCKTTIANNKMTYQPAGAKDVEIFVSGSCLVTGGATDNVKLCLCKNGVYTTQYGTMTVTIDQNNRSFNFSFNVYLSGVVATNYFEICAADTTATNANFILQDVAWLMEAR